MPKSNCSSTKQSEEWICVFELDESAGPRRNPALPRLKVTRVRTQPGDELDKEIASGKRRRAKGAVRVRYDLMPNDTRPGGKLRPFAVPRQEMAAKAAEKALIDRLSTRGFTVNGHLTVWRLYVVELEYAPPPQGKPKRGWLYVGQTKRDVATRVEQHRLGPNFEPGYKKYNQECHQFFKRVRQDLRPRWACKDLYSECDALRAEGRLRLFFEGLNYKVEGGTELLNGKPHKCGSLLTNDRKRRG